MGTTLVGKPGCGSAQCGLRSLKYGVLIMLLYVVFSLFRIGEDPRDTTTVHKTEYIWENGAAPLPFISIDSPSTGWAPTGCVAACERQRFVATIENGNHSSKRKERYRSARNVTQRSRVIANGLCLSNESLSIVGTFGDPVFRFLPITVAVDPELEGWETGGANLVMLARLSYFSKAMDPSYRHGAFNDSTRFTFMNGEAESLHEVFMHRVDARLGDPLGLFAHSGSIRQQYAEPEAWLRKGDEQHTRSAEMTLVDGFCRSTSVPASCREEFYEPFHAMLMLKGVMGYISDPAFITIYTIVWCSDRCSRDGCLCARQMAAGGTAVQTRG